MTFQDLATTLGAHASSLRVCFVRNKWSIREPADIQQFLKTRFSGKKTRAKRPYQTAAHLKKWWFVAQVRPAAAAEEIEKIQILEGKLAAAERKKMAVERRTKAEKLVAQEKMVSLETKLAEKEKVIAAKNRRLAALTRAQKSKPKAETAEILNLPAGRQGSVQNPVKKEKVGNLKKVSLKNKSKLEAKNFEVVPAAERRAAARARRQQAKVKGQKSEVKNSEKVLSKTESVETPLKTKIEPKSKTLETPPKVKAIKKVELKNAVEKSPLPPLFERGEPEKEEADQTPLEKGGREPQRAGGFSSEELETETVENKSEPKIEASEKVTAEPKTKAIEISEIEKSAELATEPKLENETLPEKAAVEDLEKSEIQNPKIEATETPPEVEAEIFEQIPAEESKTEKTEIAETSENVESAAEVEVAEKVKAEPVETEPVENSETLETPPEVEAAEKVEAEAKTAETSKIESTETGN